MEKKVKEFKGDDLPKSVIPFDSDYVHEFKPKNVDAVIKMRPMSKGEKRDYRRLSSKIAFAVSSQEEYTDFLADQWDLVGKTIESWDLKNKDDKAVEFSEDAFERLPDWFKMEIAQESVKISGLSSEDQRFLEF